MEDSMIVQMYLDRNEEAIRRTAEKYGNRLRSLSFGITSDEQTAEECENDTYMETWKRIPPSDPREYFYAFLARIIRFISIDRCRGRDSLKRNAYIVELTDELASCLPDSDDVENALNAQVLGETINRFLETLSDEKQVMFMRRYYYFDSISEISKRCAVSESKVKTSLYRIRNDLRRFLIREGYTL